MLAPATQNVPQPYPARLRRERQAEFVTKLPGGFTTRSSEDSIHDFLHSRSERQD